MYIDEKGDAEANYTVLALREDDNNYGYGLKPVGWFFRDSTHKNVVKLIISPNFSGG